MGLLRELVVLLHHVLEVLGGGHGDEGVEVLIGELVLDRDRDGGTAREVSVGDLGDDVGQSRGPDDRDDPGVPAGVSERPVAGSAEDAAAEATEELDPLAAVAGCGAGGASRHGGDRL